MLQASWEAASAGIRLGAPEMGGAVAACLADLGEGLDGVTGDEERSLDVIFPQQSQDALHAEDACVKRVGSAAGRWSASSSAAGARAAVLTELAARQHRGRGRGVVGRAPTAR